MRFQRLDLNLLVALHALLTDKSVSLAADRLCLSQSATSSALARLREYFADDLLVSKGRSMYLTARAEELIEPVRDVLDRVRDTIAVAPTFDPATADRQVRIMASDYSTQVLLADALTEMHHKAPGIRFDIQTMNEAPIEALERGLIDLLLTIDCAISTDHPSQFLFSDDYVVIGSAQNPALAGPLTRDQFFALGHVTASFGNARVPSFDDWCMRRGSRQRRIEVVAPSFMALPGLVINTNRIATMLRRLAEQVTDGFSLVMQELPFALPPIREAIQWHRTNESDPGLVWIVNQLKQTAILKRKPLQHPTVLSLDAHRWQADAQYFTGRRRASDRL
ncbi:LysR family transcriptional regulator [Novosphingobium sp. BL-8H]|uniref:LysR family transcriptional regulator n=1 Tax=Novosphingobium sp. BL-8H TaxID=3127640 RepID=UPI00375713F2